MECPVCQQESLKEHAIEPALTTYQCQLCEGVWLPALAYWDWVRSRDSAERDRLNTPEVSLPAEEIGRAKICPECGHLLRRYKVWPNVKFYLDRCGSCNGVWFDPHEWTYLKSRGAAGHVHEFFGELWQADIREEEARMHLEAIYREQFGAEDYEKVKEIRAWLWNHPRLGALIAYLTDKDPYRL